MAGIGPLLDMVLSVEKVGIFKPAAKVYDVALDRLGFAAGAISFASANPWDAAVAAEYGFRAVWVNHSHGPREYSWVKNIKAVPDLTAFGTISLRQ